MTAQMDLFHAKTPAEIKFDKVHADNPHVYRKLVQMTRDLKAQGHRKIGMQMLFEVLRWRSMMRTTDTDYKLNNDYCSRYARLIMEQEEDLFEMFETRGLKS